MTTKTPVPSPQPEDASSEPFTHYYDQHPTREDLMGESAAQSRLIFYLLSLLGWLYRGEGWFVVSNLNLYRRRQRHEHPIAPDVAVFKGVTIADPSGRALRSWRLYEPGRPSPQVVFEISSAEKWQDDLSAKPARYAAIGVREYYAYDPNSPPYWPAALGRLRGWWLVAGVMVEQPTDDQGRIWSAELASWLAPDGAWLRLYDQAGRIRLTEGEAERAAKEAAWAKLRQLGIDLEELTL